MIGVVIQAARENKKLSRRALARAAGVHYNTVLYVERGSMVPSIAILDKLCRALNLEIKFPLDPAPKWLYDTIDNGHKGVTHGKPQGR